MNTCIYIAGKITGEPYASTFLKFNAVQKQFAELGINSINPMKLGLPGDWSFLQCKDICFSVITRCTDLYLLPDYKNSIGALAEKQYAESIGIEVHEPVQNLSEYFTELLQMRILS